MTNSVINKEKLAKLQEQVRIGGKGTPRRKMKKPSKTSTDDKSTANSMRKLGVQPLSAIDEINMFMEDEAVLHFPVPKGYVSVHFLVQASISANTFIINGPSSRKGKSHHSSIELTELAPGIIEQLSPDSLERLRQMANAYMQMSKSGTVLNEDTIPHLIENFQAKSLDDQ